MSRYRLTKFLYHNLRGRGYKLECKFCNVPFQHEIKERGIEGDLIESKPSKYQNWECSGCGRVVNYKPKMRVRISLEEDLELPACPVCGSPMHCIGRKFYHADCYDEAHIEVMTTSSTTTTRPPPRKRRG